MTYVISPISAVSLFYNGKIASVHEIRFSHCGSLLYSHERFSIGRSVSLSVLFIPAFFKRDPGELFCVPDAFMKNLQCRPSVAL